MAIKMLFALSASLLTGVTQHIPPGTLITAGITGTIGWTINYFILQLSESKIVAAACGAIAVGVIAEIFARVQKEPTTIYIITGIIPLVPGLKAFNALQEILHKHYSQGGAEVLETALIAAHIASGLAVVAIAGRIYSRRLIKE